MDMASMDSCFMTIYKERNDSCKSKNTLLYTGTQHGKNDEEKKRWCERQKR